MVVETPLALRYILSDDLFLLKAEQSAFADHLSPAALSAEITEVTPVAEIQQQVIPVPTAAPVVSTPPAPSQPAVAASPAINIPSITMPPVISPVPPVASPAPVIQTPVINFNYTGGNTGAFLIVVHYPNHRVMEESHLTALTATLNKRGLTINEVAILNLAQHEGATFEQITGFFKPEKMLLLGAHARMSDLNLPTLNQAQKTANTTILYTYSFGEMMGNRDHTKAFWEQMKNL